MARTATSRSSGKYNDPVYTGKTLTTAGDFWPGFYGRTNVGASSWGYKQVMDGLRAGRVWVDHGRLIKNLDARVRVAGDRRWSTGTPLGGVLHVKRGTSTEITLDIDLQDVPNWAQFIPVLKRVDVIVGSVTGPVADKDTFKAPDTKVVKSFEISLLVEERLADLLVRPSGQAVLRTRPGHRRQPHPARPDGPVGRSGRPEARRRR